MPRRTLPGRTRLACALAVALGVAAPAAADVSLPGTWYVLVHYQDDDAPNPSAERWEDKIWVFEAQGRRLAWTEYPIVVFDDEAGRFERRSTGQYARILHYWEPDAGQRADIADGLRVNTRGSKRKTLRGSDAQGWASGRRQSAASASVITYEEVWSIEGMPSLPVFTRRDFMGSGRTDTMEGGIRYATTEVREAGDLLLGTFERDGSRHGTFRMMRTGAVGALEEKSQSEIQAQGFRRSLETSQTARREVAEQIETSLREAGVPLTDAEVNELTDLGVSQLAQGVPEAQIQERLQQRIRELLAAGVPAGARHDDSVRYAWPFDASVPRQLLQGVGREPPERITGQVRARFLRPESLANAFDFGLPVGTPVLAARAGTVLRVVDGFEEGGPQGGMATRSNAVVVTHDDGTWALYAHLRKGIPVASGQRVETGDRLGDSGATGQVFRPELLFAVQRLDADGEVRSVPIRFDDGSEEGLVPQVGGYYGGK